jgi:hypothetical protein
MTDNTPRWATGRCKTCGIWALMDGPYCVTHYELSIGKPNPLWWRTELHQPSYRHTDPATSRQGSLVMPKTWNTHKARLLAAYATALDGLTDEEACKHAGLEKGGWKRCSDLRLLGWIAPTIRTRTASSGLEQQVCEITTTGQQAHRDIQKDRK